MMSAEKSDPAALSKRQTTEESANTLSASYTQHKTPSSGMSSSLKERLKKCGRYHPATPTSSQRHSANPASASRLISRRILAENSNTVASTITTQSVKLEHENSVNEEGEASLNRDSVTTKECVLTPGVLQSSVSVSKPVTVAVNVNIRDSAMYHCNTNVTDSHPKSCSVLESGNLRVVSSIKQVHSHSEPESQGKVFEGSSGAETSGRSVEDLEREKKQLTERLMKRKEVLRKLNMVRTYRVKNDLCQLQGLINRWRLASQEAVLDLHQLIPKPQPSLTALVTQLGVDTQLMCYNEEQECFGVT